MFCAGILAALNFAGKSTSKRTGLIEKNIYMNNIKH